MNHQYTLKAAVDKVIEVYGTGTPTTLINIMRRDQENPNYMFVGWMRMHPRLLVGGQGAAGGGAGALAEMGITTNV